MNMNLYKDELKYIHPILNKMADKNIQCNCCNNIVFDKFLTLDEWRREAKHYKKITCVTCRAVWRALVSIDYDLPIDEGHWRAIFYQIDNIQMTHLKSLLRNNWRTTLVGSQLIRVLVRKYFQCRLSPLIIRQLKWLEFPNYLLEAHVNLFNNKHTTTSSKLAQYIASSSSLTSLSLFLPSLNSLESSRPSLASKNQSSYSWLPSFYPLETTSSLFFTTSLSSTLDLLQLPEYYSTAINFSRDPLYRLTRRSTTMRIVSDTRIFYRDRVYFYIRESKTKCRLVNNTMPIHFDFVYVNPLITNWIKFKSQLKNTFDAILEE